MRLIRNQVYPQGYRGFESLSLRKSNWVTTPDTVVVPRALLAWRDDRVAEGARLEIVCVERHRGFESRSLRQRCILPDAHLRSCERLWLRAT